MPSVVGTWPRGHAVAWCCDCELLSFPGFLVTGGSRFEWSWIDLSKGRSRDRIQISKPLRIVLNEETMLEITGGILLALLFLAMMAGAIVGTDAAIGYFRREPGALVSTAIYIAVFAFIGYYFVT